MFDDTRGINVARTMENHGKSGVFMGKSTIFSLLRGSSHLMEPGSAQPSDIPVGYVGYQPPMTGVINRLNGTNHQVNISNGTFI